MSLTLLFASGRRVTLFHGILTGCMGVRNVRGDSEKRIVNPRLVLVPIRRTAKRAQTGPLYLHQPNSYADYRKNLICRTPHIGGDAIGML
jgi:hypothetical protein